MVQTSAPGGSPHAPKIKVALGSRWLLTLRLAALPALARRQAAHLASPCRRRTDRWAERYGLAGRVGAIASTADQSRSVVSAVLADNGKSSLEKCAGVLSGGLKFFEP